MRNRFIAALISIEIKSWSVESFFVPVNFCIDNADKVADGFAIRLFCKINNRFIPLS